jgi:hypothetical protein
VIISNEKTVVNAIEQATLKQKVKLNYKPSPYLPWKRSYPTT